VFDIARLGVTLEARGAAETRAALKGVADEGTKTETAFNAIEDAAGKLARALGGLLAVERVATYLANATDAAGRLETALVATRAAMGLAVGETQRLGRAAADLGAGTRFSAEQVAQAFDRIAQDAGSLAETPAQLEAITAAAITLATATRTELPAAGDALLQVLRQFGGGDAQAAAAVLADLGTSADELAETAQAFTAVGATAGQLGVALPDVAAALKILAAAGIEGSQAGAALRQVLVQLETAGGRLAPSIVGVETALKNAAAAGQEWTGEALAAGRALTASADAFGATAEAIRDSDAATRGAAAVLATYEGRVAVANAALNDLSTTIGSALAPGASQAAIVTTELANAMAALVGPTGESNDELTAMGFVVGQLSGALYFLAGNFVNLGVDIGGVTAATVAFLSLDFAEAGRRWDTFFADREERARQFEETLRRISDPTIGAREARNGAALGAALGTPAGPGVVTYETELDAVGAAMAADLEKLVGGFREAPKATGGTRAPRFDAGDAQAFLAEADVQVTTDPVAGLNQQLAAELAAYAQHGADLVAAGVLAEDQRAQAILARRDANEAQLAAATAEWQQRQAADLIAFAALQADSEGEAARLRVESEVRAQYQRAIELGLGEEAAQQAALEARERGFAAIEKAEAAHSATLKAEADARWRQQVQGAITGTGALLSLFAGSNEKAFRIQKVAAIAAATLNVYASASEAYRHAAKNPARAAVMAGLAASAQLAQVVAIQGVSLGGGGGGGGAPAGGGANQDPGTYSGKTPGSGLIREAGASDAPTLDAIRASDRLPRFPAPAAGVTVNVTNNAGAEVAVNERRGPNGEATVDIVLSAVAQDIATNGSVGQAIGRRYGVQPRLGVRA
jgi:hypothetical protein